MLRYFCKTLLLLFAFVALAPVESPLIGQSSERGKVFRVNVDLVQVDVVVLDKKGNPVTDLTADDFIVLQDGKPQDITSFSMVRMQEPGANPAGAPQKNKTKDKKNKKDKLAPPEPAVKLKKEQVRRTIALVVDDLALSFEGTYRTQEALKKWVDEEMRPGDLVAIILTGSGMGSLQQFTADKRILHAAIDRIRYNISGRVGVSSFAPISSMESPMSDAAMTEYNYALTEGSMGAIQYVLSGLRDIPGRKSLILFSEDMSLFSGGGFDSFMQSPIQQLVDEANRSAVVVHAIDPRGVVYTGPTAEDSMGGLSGEEIGNVFGDRTQQLVDSQAGMIQLADMTGGRFENGNDVEGALVQTAKDGDVYYLLGYQPDERTTANMRDGYRRFHSIKVRVKRRGLEVRSRSGFFGTTESTEEEPLTRRDQMRNALYSPFTSGTLPVHLTALFSQADDKKGRINAFLHFDADQLSYSEDENGYQTAVVDVAATTFDASGEQIDLAARTWTIMAKGASFELMKKKGIVILMYIPVKKAGAYQTRVVVSDTASDLMGTATQFIEVPDIGKGYLALSGIALQSVNAQEGTIDQQQEGVVADKDANGTAAVRAFKQGDIITWAYQILNAKFGNDQQAHLQTYVRLFREGKELYTATPEELILNREEGSGRLIGTGKMELKRIDPGDYDLQVVVVDRLAKRNRQVAAQSINFTVTGAKESMTLAR